MNKFLILFLIVGLIVYLYPFAIAWRLKQLGAKSCGCKDPCEKLLGPMWAKVKGTTTLTHQTMPVKFTLQKDCASMGLLWGPRVCIKLAGFGRVERIIKNGHTIGVRFVPKETSTAREFTLEGIVDYASMFAKLAELGLNATDVAAKKNILGM